MSRKPLSADAILLLRLICSRCYSVANPETLRGQYWCPQIGEQYWQDRIGRASYWVHGMDDAARIRGLTARGLIECVEGAPVKYARRITSAGRDYLGKLPVEEKPTPTIGIDDELE